jgi:hypothetical protein
MNGAINAGPPCQPGIGGIDDSVCFLPGNVTLNDGKRGFVYFDLHGTTPFLP